jgi:hypothetical protein
VVEEAAHPLDVERSLGRAKGGKPLHQPRRAGRAKIPLGSDSSHSSPTQHRLPARAMPARFWLRGVHRMRLGGAGAAQS